MTVVQLIKMGTEIRSFEISENPTVGNLLDLAGEIFVPNTVTINGNGVTPDTCLSNGDRVFLGRATKGNTPFEVQLIRLGSSEGVVSLPCEDGMTVSQVLNQLSPDRKASFYNAQGQDVYEYRDSSGSKLEPGSTIPHPANGRMQLILSTKTKGNE